ncbi:hypothetical protein [Mucilaginibacter segetis]|uniref:Uncharacterized protein n=1 Tax=Mucilaginibacter segetis TaxID=2793071 RepID=A0A934PNT2_9SPHI|nr:hypothetical protein [Mucilaginibacter segetis]MBK0377973.1 hypothetical protein [Mucilaginibacter segetis]
MNFKIIFQLSVFGLIMAFGTIALIPQNIEPVFWLVIFVFSALVIAKVCTAKYFLHGFVLSLFNSLWISLIHAAFYATYAIHHPDIIAINQNMPAYLSIHPRKTILIMAPVFGIAFGIIQGLFALGAAKIIKK